MKVKMLDLRREYLIYRREYINAVNNIFDEGAFILGKPVENFENNVAEKLGVKYVIGVANGTDALLIAMLSAGIKENDEIITTPFTFFATGESIIHAKAKPVFVDIDERTFNIDVEKIEEAITKRTKAILPVHLYGNPSKMDKIMSIAKKHNLIVIEDCAQAIGSEYKGKKVGTFGKAGILSFFPTKNLGTAGDGGAIITNDKNINKRARLLRIHGAVKKYIHNEIGFNSRLDSLHAAILDIKLMHLDEKNNRRRKIADFYNKNLTDKIKKPVQEKGGRHIYHQYTIIVENRDLLVKHLSSSGIDSVIYYPLSLHKQKALLPYIDKKSLPISEKLSKMVLSLPIYPELQEKEEIYIVKTINSFYD
ncbi:MAG: transcriptional regulator [bacterium (Candidatus Stahlbacteria) CG23_combo_of_CG06-09_8_20_14_all_34_7]|nr:MAG: transcriptional regulator [bacterium (Candidatus Stahlbacteria) CG23_combo_of_CG06-09_8_20_14_all_34_7]